MIIADSLLGYNDFLRAVDNKVPSLVVMALTFHSKIIFFFVMQYTKLEEEKKKRSKIFQICFKKKIKKGSKEIKMQDIIVLNLV